MSEREEERKWDCERRRRKGERGEQGSVRGREREEEKKVKEREEEKKNVCGWISKRERGNT